MYQQLISLYLQFFLDQSKAPNYAQSSAHASHPESHRSFQNRHTHHENPRFSRDQERRFEMFLGLLCEFWMNQNAHLSPQFNQLASSSSAPSRLMIQLEYQVPTPMTLTAIHSLVNFIQKRINSALQSSDYRPSSHLSDPWVCLEFIQKPLFPFLNLAFSSWDIQLYTSTPIALLFRLWSNFLTPWRFDKQFTPSSSTSSTSSTSTASSSSSTTTTSSTNNSSLKNVRQNDLMSQKWRSYVQSSFPFYALLSKFLFLATKFNYASPTDCRQLQQVLNIFSLEWLTRYQNASHGERKVGLLEVCEQILDEIDQTTLPYALTSSAFLARSFLHPHSLEFKYSLWQHWHEIDPLGLDESYEPLFYRGDTSSSSFVSSPSSFGRSPQKSSSSGLKFRLSSCSHTSSIVVLLFHLLESERKKIQSNRAQLSLEIQNRGFFDRFFGMFEQPSPDNESLLSSILSQLQSLFPIAHKIQQQQQQQQQQTQQTQKRDVIGESASLSFRRKDDLSAKRATPQHPWEIHFEGPSYLIPPASYENAFLLYLSYRLSFWLFSRFQVNTNLRFLASYRFHFQFVVLSFFSYFFLRFFVRIFLGF